MSSPLFDFSHLSPEERIQLAEELGDSLEPTNLPLSEEVGTELDRRLERHRQILAVGVRPTTSYGILSSAADEAAFARRARSRG
jgi:putative addiction module component (TIGR02574 family)